MSTPDQSLGLWWSKQMCHLSPSPAPVPTIFWQATLQVSPCSVARLALESPLLPRDSMDQVPTGPLYYSLMQGVLHGLEATRTQMSTVPSVPTVRALGAHKRPMGSGEPP